MLGQFGIQPTNGSDQIGPLSAIVGIHGPSQNCHFVNRKPYCISQGMLNVSSSA